MDDQSAVHLLRDLCAIESPSGEERAAVEFLVERARRAGLDADADEAGNFVARRGAGDPPLLALGHIDTVPGRIPVRIEGGRLYGRGSVDAKGPLAALVAAAARLGDRHSGRLVIVGAVEEEAPTSKGARFVLDRYAPGFVIVGEPSGTSGVTLGYKGRVSYRLRATRGHTHTAAPSRSLAADAVALWSDIETWCSRYNAGRPAFETVDPHLAAFRTASDGLLNCVELHASFRLPPDFLVDTLQSEIDRTVAGIDPNAESIWTGYIAAFKADKRNALVAALLQAIRREGRQPAFKLKTGTSDMNLAGPVWRCPIVAYGPGDSRLDHTPDEHVEIGEYLAAVRILTDAIGRLMEKNAIREDGSR